MSGQPFGCTIATSSSYSLTVSWFNGSSVQVKLHALQVALSGPPPLPTSYPGSYVSSSATTLSSGANPAENIALTSGLTSSSLSGKVTVPIGTQSGELDIDMQLGSSMTMRLATIPITPTSTTYPYAVNVPDVSGATFALFTRAVSTGAMAGPPTSFKWTTGLTPGSNRDMTVPSAPVLVSPPPNALVPTTADFSFANTNGAAVTAHFLGGPPLVAVTTTGTSVKLPTAISIPSNTFYSWSVVADPGASGVDAAASDWLAGWLAWTSQQAALPNLSGAAAFSFTFPTGSPFTTK